MMKLRRLKIDPVESLRPLSLEEYIGQEQIKDLLWTSIQAAKLRGQPLDHVLLNGPPGLGKTTLANIIANEMGWGIKTIIAPSLGSPRIATQLLLGLGPQTILFIDEVHRVKQPVQEVFYPALEDGKIYSSLTREDTEIQLNPITFIGATTNIGKLTQPFIDRFGLQFQLEYYSLEDLSSIVMASSVKLKMPMIDWEVSETIAKRSRGTPRIANTFLKRIRDYWELDPTQTLDSEFATRIIEKKLHTDELGLRVVDHNYLRYLEKQDRPIGVDVIASGIGEDVDTVQDFIEPYLLKLGFMERRQNGRWMTEIGRTFLTTARSPR
jgi:Holliday junction DNA helicase RuvB